MTLAEVLDVQRVTFGALQLSHHFSEQSRQRQVYCVLFSFEGLIFGLRYAVLLFELRNSSCKLIMHVKGYESSKCGLGGPKP